MKDPLDSRQRAYEVLGIGRNATLAEINAAYARLTAREPSRRQELTNAWQQLRRPETRFDEDFWYYAVGDADRLESAVPAPVEALPWDPALPPAALDIGREYTDLANGHHHRDFTPISFRDIELKDSGRYDGQPEIDLPLRFDR